MRALAILSTVALACSATVQTTVYVALPAPTPADSGCRSAYAEYETSWRTARTDDLREHMEGYEDLLEEILVSELANVPSRAEVSKLREIYAVIEAFLWNAPWPRALAAADAAIARCGELSLRPSVLGLRPLPARHLGQASQRTRAEQPRGAAGQAR